MVLDAERLIYSFAGFGVDLKLNLTNILSIYGGYSQNGQLFETDNVESIETGVSYGGNEVSFNLKYLF